MNFLRNEKDPMFKEFLESLDTDEQKIFGQYIKVISKHVPSAEQGICYGMPAFKYKDRPLIGFGSNKFGLSVYPFDPRVIEDLKTELKDFETTKGTIKFTVKKPLPDELITLIADTRLSYLNQ